MHGPHGPGPSSGQSHEYWEHRFGILNTDKVSTLVHSAAAVNTGHLGKVQAEVFTKLFTLELVEAVAKVTPTAPEPRGLFVGIGVKGDTLGRGKIIDGIGIKAHVQQAPGPGRSQRNMWRNSVALVRLASIDNHADKAFLFTNKEDANLGFNAAPKGHEAPVSQSTKELDSKIPRGPESAVPVRANKPAVTMDMLEFLIRKT